MINNKKGFNPKCSFIFSFSSSSCKHFTIKAQLRWHKIKEIHQLHNASRWTQSSLFCPVVQVLQHSAAVAAGLRWADGGGGEGRPRGPVRPRHGDLPPAGPEQTLRHRLHLRNFQQPVQLEEHARVQHPAGLQGPRPHPPVRQEEIRGRPGGRAQSWQLDKTQKHCMHTETCSFLLRSLHNNYLWCQEL